MFTLIQAQKPNLGERIDDWMGAVLQAIFQVHTVLNFDWLHTLYVYVPHIWIYLGYIQILGDVTVVQVCALCLFCIDIYIYIHYDVDI